MLGFKSLEQKLRKDNARTAPATVIEIAKGKSLSWQDDTGQATHGSGNTAIESVALSKDKYRLRVQPDGEPEFEAIVKVSEDDFIGSRTLRVGSAVVALFDPADHERVAIDVAATKAEMQSHVKTINVRPEDFGRLMSGLAAPNASPAPDVTEQLTRLAELRDNGVLTDQEFAAEKAKLLAAN
jgi:hypothetical protein